MTEPKILEKTPPPPEVRQDDPNLPKGEVKEIEHAAWGAKVVFHRTVEKDGQVLIDEDWTSRYRAWAAVFLVGTKE